MHALPAPFRFPHAVAHVEKRDDNRAADFFDDEDGRYSEVVTDAALVHRVSILASVMMTHRVHLLAMPKRLESVARMMQRVGQMVHRFLPSPSSVQGHALGGLLHGGARGQRRLTVRMHSVRPRFALCGCVIDRQTRCVNNPSCVVTPPPCTKDIGSL